MSVIEQIREVVQVSGMEGVALLGGYIFGMQGAKLQATLDISGL
jgi:hypothetical protein